MAVKYNGYLNVLFVADLGRARDFYQNVMGLEYAYAELRSRGTQFLRVPEDRPWGLRCAHFKDPDGNIWEIHSPVSGG